MLLVLFLVIFLEVDYKKKYKLLLIFFNLGRDRIVCVWLR